MIFYFIFTIFLKWTNNHVQLLFLYFCTNSISRTQMMPPYCSVSYSFVRRWGNLNLRIWQKTDGKCAIWCHNLKCKVSIYVCVILFNFIDSRKKKNWGSLKFCQKKKERKKKGSTTKPWIRKTGMYHQKFWVSAPSGCL